MLNGVSEGVDSSGRCRPFHKVNVYPSSFDDGYESVTATFYAIDLSLAMVSDMPVPVSFM